MHFKTVLFSFGLVAHITAQQATQTHYPTPSSLLRRDGAPAASCPEQLGSEPMNCGDPACGGQRDGVEVCENNSGNGKPCACKVGTSDEPAPVPTTTMVTKTDSTGAMVTGVYDLVTIDKYKSLKQSQTITVTQTTTGPDGKETEAAVAGVVAAGGVMWILGTSADAAGAALLAETPPAPPEGHKDDPSCPAQKHKCSECGAVPGIGICVLPDAGCACDADKSCPADDKKPQCSACNGQDGNCTTGEDAGCACISCPTGDKEPQCSACNGQDEKCTTGESKGCSCKSSGCPEPGYTPFCDFCGGKGNDGKCKGISDANNLWSGCDCLDFDKDVPQPPSLGDQIGIPQLDDLPDVTPSSYSYGGDDPLKCLNLDYGAKREDLEKSVTEWCKSVDGKKVTKTGDTDVIYKRFDYRHYSYWLGAQYDGESGGNCGDSASVREINCVSTMLEELEDCNFKDTEFKGAELTDGCVKYHISLSQSRNDNNPPFKSLEMKSAECSNDVTDVKNNFWQGVSKTFCQRVGDGKTSVNVDLQNTDLQTRSVFKRTPPTSKGAYKGFVFQFGWQPNQAAICTRTCDEAMSTIADQCGAYAMRKEGTLDVGCGKYSFKITPPPEPVVPIPTPTRVYSEPIPTTYATELACITKSAASEDYHNRQTWGEVDDRSPFQRAIDEFCGAIDLATAPELSTRDGGMRYYFKSRSTTAKGGPKFINIAVTAKPGCVVPLQQSYCRASLGAIMDRCPWPLVYNNPMGMGGATSDNCGIFYLTRGVEIDEPRKNDPLREMIPQYGWDDKHLCFPMLGQRC